MRTKSNQTNLSNIDFELMLDKYTKDLNQLETKIVVLQDEKQRKELIVTDRNYDVKNLKNQNDNFKIKI